MSQLSKKSKFFIGIGSGLLTTTAIVTPLATSCASSKIDNDVTGYDKQYNINDVTYKRLQTDIKNLYVDKIDHESHPARERRQLIDAANAKIDKFVSTVDETKANDSRELSYYEKTESLIEFADKQFNFKVSRNFSETPVNWTLENQKLKSDLEDTLKSLMTSGDFPASRMREMMDKFNSSYNSFKAEVDAKNYADPLKKLNEIKAHSLQFYDGLCDEVSQLAAQSVIRNVNAKHNFYLDNDNKSTNDTIYWDDIKQLVDDGELQVNDDISEWAQDHFRLLDSVTGKISTEKLDLTNLASGYTFTPIFKGLTSDPSTNHYGIMIDWVCSSNENLNLKLKPTASSPFNYQLSNKLSGHSFTLKTGNSMAEFLAKNSQTENILGFMSFDDSYKTYKTYDLPVKPQTERQAIKDAYLDKITFEWDTMNAPASDPYKNCAYEAFFGVSSDVKFNKTFEPTGLAMGDLARAGLRLTENANPNNSKRLGDLLENTKKPGTLKQEDITILESFVTQCDLVSQSQVVDDDTHEVKNKLFAYYKNSTLPSNTTEEGKQVQIGKDNTFDCIGFPISETYYKYASKSFNKAKAWLDGVKAGIGKVTAPWDDMINPMYLIGTVLLTIMCVTCVICFFKNNNSTRRRGITEIFVTNKYISKDFDAQTGEPIRRVVGESGAWEYVARLQPLLCLINGIFLLSCLGTLIGLGVTIKMKADGYTNKFNQFKKETPFVAIDQRITDDYNNIFKDYNTFKKTPMSTVFDKMFYYRNFKQLDDYKNIESSLDKLALHSEQLNKEILPKLVKIYNLVMIITFAASILILVATIIMNTIVGAGMAQLAKTFQGTVSIEANPYLAAWTNMFVGKQSNPFYMPFFKQKIIPPIANGNEITLLEDDKMDEFMLKNLNFDEVLEKTSDMMKKYGVRRSLYASTRMNEDLMYEEDPLIQE